MTKHDFLERLDKALGKHPDRREILADYEEHFAAAREEGRFEAEVAEALGDPEELGFEYRANLLAKEAGERLTPVRGIRVMAAAARLRYGRSPLLLGLLVAGGILAGFVACFALIFAFGGLGGALSLALAPLDAVNMRLDLNGGSALRLLAGIALSGISLIALVTGIATKAAESATHYVREKTGRETERL